MRKIIFKGKRVDNGEWVEGSLLVTKYNTFIIPYHDETIQSVNNISVISETIGQFTGFLDKNGRVWEGKITLEIVGVGIGIAEIVMHKGCWNIFEETQGYYLLSEALGNQNIIISNIHN